MSLDTKYRPAGFADVLGQQATIRILRGFITSGHGFRQSYLFAGQWGSGKTTLGRILARALLCEQPTAEGDPCDKCLTCTSLLEQGNADCFVEVDAATNSGKAEIKRIIEEIQYATFSGRRRIYLFDESHQLSTNALDALLKPMEETVPSTGDKALVCIFCTTEPEKMRYTVLSRCAPAFVIQPVSPEKVAERLAFICEQEGLTAEPGMLQFIAEATECHIRDALKAVEGVSMLGAIDRANVVSYLHLDLNATLLEILAAIGTDLGRAMTAATSVMQRASPTTCYQRLAEIAMLAYQVHLGFLVPPSFWDVDLLKAVGAAHQVTLLSYAERFASRPARPTANMLLRDIAALHHLGGVALSSGQTPILIAASPEPKVVAPAVPPAPTTETSPAVQAKVSQPPETGPSFTTSPPERAEGGKLELDDQPRVIGEGVYWSRKASRRGLPEAQPSATSPPERYVGPDDFSVLLGSALLDLEQLKGGSSGRTRMDRD